jgi:NTE family protein
MPENYCEPSIAKYMLSCFLLVVLAISVSAQDLPASSRPKIGLTLSGGGAKGLAHIGILKAIDSAGLKIDYITGTSMGAIIGGLYAAGYSSEGIEQIARTIDWDQLLSNQSSLRNIIMEEKDEYGKYDIELPWVNHWFRLPTGILEGQELGLKFAELFFPVYNIKDFSRLSIPFKCIATDVSTGDAVVLDSGEIVTALRSTMAIPSLFTAVENNGKKLVDGGIVRNFPVRDVKEMGANLVIGSNVSGPLLATEKVTNAIQILLQVAFFREAEDTKIEVPLCTIYIPIPLDKYSMGSFSESDEILQAGLKEGRKLYPILKELSDSLNKIYGPQEARLDRLPQNHAVKITSFEVRGTHKTTSDYFIFTTDFETNRYYSAEDLSRLVRKAWGTRLYNRISYSLEPQADSSCKIIFDVIENPFTVAKIGLNYNQFSGISAILDLTTRDFFTPNSRSLVTFNIGENFRLRAEHLQYFSRESNFTFILGTQFDQFNITTYDNYKAAGLYDQSYLKLDGKLGYYTNRNISIDLGTRFEWIKNSPSINPTFEFLGKSNFTTSYLLVRHNSLDRPVYPKRGLKIEAEGDWVYQQYPALNFHYTGNNQDSIITSNPYQRILLNLEGYLPLGKRYTLLSRIQTGTNFNYGQNILNEFSIGGLTNIFHNEITFAGLREGTFYAPSVAAFLLGIRYELFSNTYLTGKANTLFSNFISKSPFFNTPDFLSGYSLTFSYNFALGPLEISAMYCDQSRKVIGYLNIGIPF